MTFKSKVILAALYGAVLAGVGYQLGSVSADTELARLKQAHAEEKQAIAQQASQQLAIQTQQLRQEEASHLADLSRFEAEKTDLVRKIPRVTTVYKTVSGDVVRIPECVFTVGWLREYNAALGLADHPAIARRAGTEAESTDAVDPELLRESGVTPADILAHIGDYGQRCRGLESQVIRLIDQWPAPEASHE